MRLTGNCQILFGIILLISFSQCVSEYRHDSDFDDLFENFPNGKPKTRAYWIDHEKQIMEQVSYAEKGGKKITCRVFTETGAGYCRYWNEDGTLSAYTTIKDFITSGPYIGFHPNGTVQSAGFYMNGKFEGINTAYRDDTRIETIAFLKEGTIYLEKNYFDNDSTSFSVKLQVVYPETILKADSYFNIEYSIPYIDTLPEMKDSFFVRHDLYITDEVNSLPLHRPRYNEYLERGWVRATFEKKTGSKEYKDTLYYLSGFLYRKLEGNKLDTLDYFGPFEIKIVD